MQVGSSGGAVRPPASRRGVLYGGSAEAPDAHGRRSAVALCGGSTAPWPVRWTFGYNEALKTNAIGHKGSAMASERHERAARSLPRFFTSEMLLLIAALISGMLIVWSTLSRAADVRFQVGAGIVFTLSMVLFFRLLLDPESVRARQSDAILKLASRTLDCSKDGLNPVAAQKICELLLPATAAIAVAITDKANILGYAGYTEANRRLQGVPVRTRATHATIEDGRSRILLSPDEIGFPVAKSRIRAAIIMPLYIGRKIEGTLKFYYRRPRQVSQTQVSMAEGFAELISTQMAASALEDQTRLAQSLELKALQAQINPHFLYNTINTIASTIRTDPSKARELLRDFAAFYRSTLEDSSDLIMLSREMSQVRRYFSFMTARFGEDRLALVERIDEDVAHVMVPSLMIQPIVENSIRHGMPAEGRLTVSVVGSVEGEEVVIRVIDDGKGMTPEQRDTIMNPCSSEGLGIAVKNVRDRMTGYYGGDAGMHVESELGRGTAVTFRLKKDAADMYVTTKDLEQSLIPPGASE